ncbi:MAG: energy transducer TonB [Marinoscillum sp.]|uniref:energy transducer TonB n=1 Tax=Marinoscillum sp. TaxID=2024838 RepID=UPI0032F6A275
MRYLIHFFLFLLVCNLSVAQDYEPTPEQIEAKKRFENAKQQFLNNQFAYVLDYYDSILSEQSYTRFETYKMVNESCSRLAVINSEDSALYLNLAEEAYNEAIKWYGKMHVEERWDSLKIEINKEPEVFKIVDQQPEFPGGMAAFYKYVGQEMKYPEEARRMGVEGRVYVQFVINKDGSVDAVNAVKGIGGGCDEEAVRVIANAPDFIPGKQEGEPVYVRMVMPVIFKLAGKPSKKKKKKRG